MAQRGEWTGLDRWKFVRGAWALWAFSTIVAAVIAPEVVAYTFGADARSVKPAATAGNELSTAELGLVVTGFALVVVLLVMLLIVMRTGRPHFLVLKPCRGMSPDEIEAWLAPRINLWAWKRETSP